MKTRTRKERINEQHGMETVGREERGKEDEDKDEWEDEKGDKKGRKGGRRYIKGRGKG